MTTDNLRPGPISTGRRRDRYQLAVVAVTGVATAGCLTATGWIVGQAADSWSAQQQAPTTVPTGPLTTTEQPAVSRPRHRAKANESDDERVVLRERPTRTRVTTRYVRPPATVGGGGSVSSTPSQPHSNPAPAPSSGS